MKKKTWIEKRDCEKSFKIKTIAKKFADIPEGSKMLIATPKIIDDFVNTIPFGNCIELSDMRTFLAAKYKADKTCPVTTGIFLRIVAEASFEEYNFGKNLKEITPFWRIVNPNSKLAEKLQCGIDFIKTQRKIESVNK